MMEEEEEIKDRKTLEQIIANLKEKKDIVINIPEMHTSEILKIFKKYGINYSRIGFKRWNLSPKTSIIKGINRTVVVFRIICLISTIILLILLIYGVFSLFWIRLELYFNSLPLASGIVSGVTLIVIPLVGKLIFKKNIRALLRSYLVG